MIKVILLQKQKSNDIKGSIKFYRVQKGSFEINRPENYKEFEKEIRNQFNLNGKEIAIKALIENEEKNIKNDDDYNDEDLQSEIYHVIFEGDEENSSNALINLDAVIDVTSELTIDENEFKLYLDKHLEKEIKEEFKLDEIDEKIDLKAELDKNYYPQIEKKLEGISEEKKKSLIDSVKNEFSSIIQAFEKKICKINDDIKKNMKESNKAKEKISNINQKLPKFNPDIPDNQPQLPKMFSLSLNEVKYHIPISKADNFSINDIKIKNILDKKIIFNHKYWIKHEDSAPEISFPSGKKEVKVEGGCLEEDEEKNSELYLSIENPKINHDYFLKFFIGDNSKNNKSYENVTEEPILITVKIIKDEEKEENEIDNDIKLEEKKEKEKEEKKNEEVKDKKEEDKKKDKDNGEELSEELVEEIYNEIEGEFYVSSIIGEEEMKEKIRELNGDIEKIKEFAKKCL